MTQNLHKTCTEIDMIANLWFKNFCIKYKFKNSIYLNIYFSLDILKKLLQLFNNLFFVCTNTNNLFSQNRNTNNLFCDPILLQYIIGQPCERPMRVYPRSRYGDLFLKFAAL